MTPGRIGVVVRRMRVVVACVVALLVALAAGVENGHACSCALPNPRAAIVSGDGAFVGTLRARRETDRAAVLTFSVEKALKGPIGTTVEVVTSSNSAACGVELAIGARTGLVLERSGGAWRGSLCWQFDSEELLAAGSPLPAPNGRGPVALVVGAELGNVRLLALDARGRTLAYGNGTGRANLVSFCPDRLRLVEIASTATGTGSLLVVREARTLRTVRRQVLRLPTFRYPQRLRCPDSAGASVLLFARGGRASATRSALYRIRQRRVRAIWEGTAYDGALSSSTAYLSAARRGRQLIAIDATTGRVRPLAVLPGATTALALDERAERLAGIRDRRAGPSELVVGRPRSAQPHPTAAGPESRRRRREVHWLPGSRLLYLPSWGAGAARVLDATLQTSSRFRWNAASGAVVVDEVFGIDQTLSLYRAELPSGPQRAARRLPCRPSLIVSARG